jgi:fructose-1,6-bisphosphatase/inositol monophosphatase family enzyme
LSAGAPLAASGATPIEVALRCAREGGALAMRYFRSPALEIGEKGRGNIVTEADLAVERLIIDILRDEYPAMAVLSEETSAETDPTRGWVWVIDPIDGTKNYSYGLPGWCVNVALCRDGDPVCAVTYDAVHDETFWAVAGGGAHLDETNIAASAVADVRSSVLGLDLGYDEERGAGQIDLMRRIFPNVQAIRIIGSAALGFAYAACGRLDIFTHSCISPWDIAAGMLLVREAGGAATDPTGAPLRITSSGFVAGGRRVHADFMARYASAQGESAGG